MQGQFFLVLIFARSDYLVFIFLPVKGLLMKVFGFKCAREKKMMTHKLILNTQRFSIMLICLLFLFQVN